MSQQEIETNRLVNIIQKIQLGRGTGLLTARRGVSATQEEGTITFVNGKVAEARVGRRTGAEALNVLSTWGTCHYIFITSHSTPMLEQSLDQRPSSPYTMTTPIDTNTPPYLPVSPLDARANVSETNKLQGNVQERFSAQTTDPLPNITIPQSTRQLDSALRMIENMGLSRAHRRLLLLVDGKRSLPELARLIGRKEDEVYALLHDLAKASVIRISNKQH
ncbi:MAG: hypothetical protein NVS4B11_25030 [Ktedonobacteraceae bacterium]